MPIERRLKGVFIEVEEFLAVFRQPLLKGPTKETRIYRYRALHLVDLPETAEAVDITFDHRRRAFFVAFYDPSFPVVDVRSELPILETNLQNAIADQHGDLKAVGIAWRNKPGEQDGSRSEGGSWIDKPPLF